MRRTAPFARHAFTMVELLVAMALMVTLASIALVVVPDVMSQDRTTDAAGTVRQWLTIAKSRAARDQQPRGVRFIVALDPNNPAKTNALWVTELQYIEATPYLNLSVSENSTTPNVALNFLCAYDVNGNMIFGQIPGTGTSAANPAVFSPQCIISNLSAASAVQIQVGSLLTVTPLGTSHRVLNIASSTINLPPSTAPSTVTVVLDSFPQAQLGAAGAPATTNPPQLQPIYSTTLFGITASPQPLVGEPPLPLPRNICVDLTASASGSTVLSTLQNALPQPPDVDIVFLPSGQVAPTWLPVNIGGKTTFLTIGSTSQIFLWVRDYTKNGGLGSGLVQNGNGTQSTNLAYFQQGGEQQIVSLKTKSGAMGVFPVSWPDFTGTYGVGLDPYTFARLGATSP